MSNLKMIHIGFGNIVLANRVIAIVSPESAPIKRIIQEFREKGCLVDATHGRRTRAVIMTDSNYIILSALQPETVAGRINGKDEIIHTYPETESVPETEAEFEKNGDERV